MEEVMKKIVTLSLITIVLLGIILSPALAEESRHQVIAYYFHGKARCVTCSNMETYAKEAVETAFSDEIASNALTFLSLDMEKEENKQLVQDYQLFSQSLIVSLVRDGREVKSKNLDRIWLLARNKSTFMAYVTEEIQSMMQEAREWN
jgi:hypothetical protein